MSAPFLAVTSSGLLTIIVLLWLNLKLSYRQLEEYAETLEVKVDERTKDLQASQRAILQQEQFLRMVINNIPQQIFWKDRNFRLLGGNSNWAKAMGIQEPEQLLGEVIDQWESDRDQINFMQTQEQEILAHNQPLMHQERKVELDGQVKWFNESKLPIQDPTGEVVGLLGVVDDVTIYKNAEEAMAIAKQKAEEASQAKSTFIANMSHELRTPLNAIIGFSKIMGRDRNLGDKTRNNLKIINQSGEYLLTLINNILDLSKIEAGKTTFNPQNFDLYNLLDEVENLLKLKAEDKDLYFRIERETSVDQYIHTDAVKLRQVLINLANNAIKFTSEGGVIVRVAAPLQTSTSDLTIEFAIADTGEGIAEEELDTIFESFGQSASGRNAQEGTGLGLPISRKFVRMMGGEIEVTSELGVGTTFTFAIQAQRASPEEAQQAMIKPRTIIGLAPGQPTYKLMVVDDIAANRALICQLLEPIGFELKSASNGQEAVAQWPSWQPRLTFMDIKMPGMNGYDATKAIKNIAPQTIVIALTASILEEEKGAIFAAGCDAIINKPFQESEIFDALSTYLGVSYLYEEQATPSPEEELPPAEFTPALLQNLNPALVTELSNYAIAGSDDDLIALLQTLGPEHQSLVHHLSLLASQFEFEQIIDLLSSPDFKS
ncbi:MAG: response regulator [Synechococcaceae cyanobacterium RL_1_2]|nr:response regulator [Synechococcaceae cyanobacterium RL_1_2]